MNLFNVGGILKYMTSAQCICLYKRECIILCDGATVNQTKKKLSMPQFIQIRRN